MSQESQLPITITLERYQAAIPKGCCYQTVEQHQLILGGCWGLLSAIKENRPMICGCCPLNQENKK